MSDEVRASVGFLAHLYFYRFAHFFPKSILIETYAFQHSWCGASCSESRFIGDAPPTVGLRKSYRLKERIFYGINPYPYCPTEPGLARDIC